MKRIAFRIAGVGLLVTSVAVLGNGLARTFLRPTRYMASALVQVNLASNSASLRPLKSEMDQLLSTRLLVKVCRELNLASVYSDRYRPRWGMDDLRLREREALLVLKRSLDIRMLKSPTGTIQIRAFSENAEESAQIANALARGYRDLSAESPGTNSPGRDLKVIEAEVPPGPVSFRFSLTVAIILAIPIATAGICLLILGPRFPPLVQPVVASRLSKY